MLLWTMLAIFLCFIFQYCLFIRAVVSALESYCPAALIFAVCGCTVHVFKANINK